MKIISLRRARSSRPLLPAVWKRKPDASSSAEKRPGRTVSLYDPMGTGKEGKEITLINILGFEVDAVIQRGGLEDREE